MIRITSAVGRSGMLRYVKARVKRLPSWRMSVEIERMVVVAMFSKVLSIWLNCIVSAQISLGDSLQSLWSLMLDSLLLSRTCQT